MTTKQLVRPISCAVYALAVFSATAVTQVQIAAVNGKPGQTATFSVDLSDSGRNIAGFNFTLVLPNDVRGTAVHDGALLDGTSFTLESRSYTEGGANKVSIVGYSLLEETIAGGGALATVTVDIAPTVTAGTHEIVFAEPPTVEGIYVNPQALSNEDGSVSLALTTVDGSITIEVDPDTDADSLPDAWELEHFSDLSQDGDGDFDDDGVSNLDEFNAGTNPSNPADPGGGITVTLSPAGAVDNGAQWRVTAGGFDSGPRNSGAQLLGVPPGTYVLTFTTVNDWLVPSSQSITIAADTTTTAVGIYREPTGELVIQPGALDFGTVAVGETRRRHVSITNAGDVTARINAIEINESGFTADLAGQDIDPGDTVLVPVDCSPSIAGAMETSVPVGDAVLGMTAEGKIDPVLLTIGNVQRLIGDTGTFTVGVDLDAAADLSTVAFTVHFPAAVVRATSLRKAGRSLTNPQSGSIDNTDGNVVVSIGQFDGATAIPAGNGTIVEIDFQLTNTADIGAFALVVDEINNVFKTDFSPLPVSAQHGELTVVDGVSGDVDGSGTVDALDAIFIFRTVTNLSAIPPEVNNPNLPPSAEIEANVRGGLGEYNNDGALNALDAIDVFRAVTNLPPRGSAGAATRSARLTKALLLDIPISTAVLQSGQAGGSAGDNGVVVPIFLENVAALSTIGFDIVYDTTVLDAVALRRAGRTIAGPQSGGINDAAGRVTVSIGNLDGSEAIPAGNGIIFELEFNIAEGAAAGTYALDIANINNVYSIHFTPVILLGVDGAFTVESGNQPPVAACTDVAVSINADGVATIGAQHIDAGSSDADGTIAERLVNGSSDPVAFTCSAIGENPVTLTVRDDAGGSDTCNAIVTVIDDGKPDLVVDPLLATIPLGSGTPDLSAGVTAFDNCDGDMTDSIQIDSDSLDTNSPGDYTVFYTVTDTSGNATQAGRTYRVSADCPFPSSVSFPTIDATLIGHVRINGLDVSADDFVGAFVGDEARGCRAVDVIDDMAYVNINISAAGGPETVRFELYRAQNARFHDIVTDAPVVINPATAIGSIAEPLELIIDTIPPVITDCPDRIEVPTDVDACRAHVFWTAPSATDDNGVVELTASHQPGDAFALGNDIVVYQATDRAGNTSTCAVEVSVRDNEAPAITGCPAGITVTTDAGECFATAVWDEPTVTDNCTDTEYRESHAPGDRFARGTTPVLITAADAAGNTAACGFNITVIDRESPEFLSCPDDVIAATDSGSCSAMITWLTPEVVDHCGPVVIESSHDNGERFVPGTTSIRITAADAAGNTAACAFNVTVVDTEPPTVSGCPANMTVETESGACTAVADWRAPTITDQCGDIDVAANPAPGTSLAIGMTTVVYTATDSAGNTATCQFNVTIHDTAPPEITFDPPEVTLFIGDPPVDFGDGVAASDDCDGDVTGNIAFDPSMVDTAAPGRYPVEYQVGDRSGNVGIGVRIYLVTDEVEQVIAVRQGWNHISFNVRSDDMSPQTVLAEIMDNVERVIGAGRNFNPNNPGPFNTLGEFEIGQAYWIKVLADADIAITGRPAAPSATPISLKTGWNGIGYVPQSPMPIEVALSGIVASIERVIGDNRNYAPNNPSAFNTLRSMQPGLGYWINVLSPALLIYPEADAAEAAQTFRTSTRSAGNPASRKSASPAGATGMTPEERTGWTPQHYPTIPFTLTGRALIDGVDASTGDVVAAFVGDEVRGIATTFMHNDMAFVVINVAVDGDDETAGFKLYDVDKDAFHDIDFTTAIAAAGEMGERDNPVVLDTIGGGVAPPIPPAMMHLTKGWNLVSLHVAPHSTDPVDIFGRHALNVWEWHRDGTHSPYYRAPEELRPRVGYWIYAEQQADVVISGESVDGVGEPLHRGWNLIGPTENKPAPAGSSYWGFHADRYYNAETLEILRGYWIYVDPDAATE